MKAGTERFRSVARGFRFEGFVYLRPDEGMTGRHERHGCGHRHYDAGKAQSCAERMMRRRFEPTELEDE